MMLIEFVERIRDELKDPVVLGTDTKDYRCIQPHTAAAANKPVTGGSYEEFWVVDPLISNTIGKAWVEDASYDKTRWINAILEEHIKAAAIEYSRYRPLSKINSTIDAAQSMTISSITDLIRVTALAWPSDQYPPRMRKFWEWPERTTVHFLPVVESWSNKADIYYEAEHSIGTASTVPTEDDEIIVTGGCMYALGEYAAYMANRFSPGDASPFYQQEDSYKNLFYGMLGVAPQASRKK